MSPKQVQAPEKLTPKDIRIGGVYWTRISQEYVQVKVVEDLRCGIKRYRVERLTDGVITNTLYGAGGLHRECGPWHMAPKRNGEADHRTPEKPAPAQPAAKISVIRASEKVQTRAASLPPAKFSTPAGVLAAGYARLVSLPAPKQQIVMSMIDALTEAEAKENGGAND